MTDLNTSYLKLKLKNPVIAGASHLTGNEESIKKIEEAGAAAIVFKSLFEEQIALERLQIKEITEEYDERYAEMADTFPTIDDPGPQAHLFALEKAKKRVGIPVIASLNATSDAVWKDYAKELENSGADAIELNLYYSAAGKMKKPQDIEQQQISIISEVKKTVKIPVSAKLSFFYSNPFYTIKSMDQTGIDGFVLFNRLFEPDIDIDNEEYRNPFNLSSPNDVRLALRYAGILYEEVKADICTSTGIFSGTDVISMLLAGADCIQCVSTLYINGISQISKMLDVLDKWMKDKGYEHISDFRGKLSAKNISDPFIFGRNQYIDILLNREPIIRKREM